MTMSWSMRASCLTRAAACVLACFLALGASEAGPRKGGRVVGECAGVSGPDGPGWREWSELVQVAVRKAWKPPISAQRGAPGLVLLRFRVDGDGTVTDLLVIKEKATKGMVHAATEAVLTASPFPPLPPLVDDDDGRIFINYLFAYNVSDKASCRFRDRWSP